MVQDLLMIQDEKAREKENKKIIMDSLVSRLDGERCVAGIKKKDLAVHWGVSPSVVTDVFKRRTQMSFSYLSRTHDLLKKATKAKLMIYQITFELLNSKIYKKQWNI
jgi:methylphosphotriester-DNA--protein-cysteine methyltransferase